VKRQLSILVIVLVAATAAVGAAPARSTAPACAGSGLVVWIDTNGDATAGSTYFQLKFTNQSGHACTLQGYPGVSAVDLGGRRLGSAASRDVSAAPVVRLANGDTAKARLRIVVAGNFPAATCQRRAAAGLRVYPPNETASKVVPIPFEACSRSGPIVLSVQAVARG
jgi:hypothetical protein